MKCHADQFYKQAAHINISQPLHSIVKVQSSLKWIALNTSQTGLVAYFLTSFMCHVVATIILTKSAMKYKEMKINIFSLFLSNSYSILILIFHFNWEVFGIRFNKYKANPILSSISFPIVSTKPGSFSASRVTNAAKYT